MRLVFAGTPAAALPSLQALLASRHEVVAVLTRPAKRSGRGRHVLPSPIAALANEAGLEILAPPSPADADFLERLVSLEPDCCPVVAYGALLPPTALQVPSHGWINLHFSLLPAWRGAAPVAAAIRAGDDLTGASTFRIEAGLDTGPVFGTVTDVIAPRDTAGDLLGRLAVSGARLLVATLDGVADGSVRPVPQSGEGISYAPKTTVADARVDWSAPATAVDRQVRAYTPDPGAWSEFRDTRLGIGPVMPLVEHDPRSPASGPSAPGALVVGRREVLVGTASGPVRLGEVRPAGKPPMPAADWARGARIGPVERLV